jgi:hypothetical protein
MMLRPAHLRHHLAALRVRITLLMASAVALLRACGA